MPTENTSLKNTTPVGNSNTTKEMIIGESNTYQRPMLIVAASLLALFVLIAVAGTTGGQHLQSSAHEIAKGGMALADYQVDSANLAFNKDIFGLDAVSENDEGCGSYSCSNNWCTYPCSCCDKYRHQNSCIACLDGRECCDRVTKAWSYNCCAN